MYQISIISIGDELCIGQTVNTNAAWISQQISKTGGFVTTHSTIRDEKDTIIAELDRLKQNSDLIIITGGLGPTHDDITKIVLTEYFKDELTLNTHVLTKLKDWFESRERQFYKRHEQQAMLPSKAQILPNDVGTAQGMLFNGDGFSAISLPGVPREMKFIIKNSVLPYIKDQIKQRNSEVQVYRTIKTAGIAESDLAELIGDLNFLRNVSLAFLPSYKGVKLRIGLEGKTKDIVNNELDRVENHIRNQVGKFITVTGEEDLAQTVGDLLSEKKQTVSVAESCTGGLLGANFTEIPGSSAYFLGGVISYANEAKTNLLNVGEDILNSFGAVSEETAILMAKNVRKKFNSDYGISITGIAGPGGGTKTKPVGTVWIGLADASDSFAKKYVFSRDRQINREISVGIALTQLYNRLRNS